MRAEGASKVGQFVKKRVSCNSLRAPTVVSSGRLQRSDEFPEVAAKPSRFSYQQHQHFADHPKDKITVNQTRSGHKIGDECSSKVHGGGKEGSSTSHYASDSYGLRRSTRESSSKKPMIPSFPTTRKSGRLETRTLPTSVSKDREKVKIRRTPSPARRSERCKKRRCFSDYPRSKKSARRSESSGRRNQVEKKGNNAKRLEVEDKEFGKSNEDEPASTQMKRRKLNARAYRALFSQIRKRG